MRLIGGRDYYDSALAYGRDNDIVFVRSEPWKMNWKHFKVNPVFASREIILNKSDGWRFRPAAMDYRVSSLISIVAGKRYNAIRFEDMRQIKGRINRPVKLFYDLASYEKYLNDEWDCRIPKPHNRESGVAYFFDRKITPDEYQFLIDNRIVTALFDECTEVGSNSYGFNRDNEDWIINGDNLKSVSLARVLDPYTCFQEISMWVGGVLPRNPNPMVEITDDKIKVAKHGFDKWSFRKHKEDK